MIYRMLCGLAIMAVGTSAWSVSLKDNGDGTVADLDSGTTWQQVDDGNKRNWKEARAYCEALTLAGTAGWRLPTPTELASIVVYQTSDPTIDEALFPSTKSAIYWTGTEMVGYSWQAWSVDFHHGPVDFSSKKSSHYVRCIK